MLLVLCVQHNLFSMSLGLFLFASLKNNEALFSKICIMKATDVLVMLSQAMQTQILITSPLTSPPTSILENYKSKQKKNYKAKNPSQKTGKPLIGNSLIVPTPLLITVLYCAMLGRLFPP